MLRKGIYKVQGSKDIPLKETLYKSLEEVGSEDGGETGGSRVYFPLLIGGIFSQSSEEKTEQPMVSQQI